MGPFLVVLHLEGKCVLVRAEVDGGSSGEAMWCLREESASRAWWSALGGRVVARFSSRFSDGPEAALRLHWMECLEKPERSRLTKAGSQFELAGRSFHLHLERLQFVGYQLGCMLRFGSAGGIASAVDARRSVLRGLTP